MSQFAVSFRLQNSIAGLRSSLRKSVHHPVHRRMLAVLDLDPVLRWSTAIGPIAMFRDQSLKSELAYLQKQVRPDLAPFEVAHKDAIRSAGQQASKIGLAQ